MNDNIDKKKTTPQPSDPIGTDFRTPTHGDRVRLRLRLEYDGCAIPTLAGMAYTPFGSVRADTLNAANLGGASSLPNVRWALAVAAQCLSPLDVPAAPGGPGGPGGPVGPVAPPLLEPIKRGAAQLALDAQAMLDTLALLEPEVRRLYAEAAEAGHSSVEWPFTF